MAEYTGDDVSMDITVSNKCSRPSGDSLPSTNKKNSKKKGGYTCPMCIELIIESTKSKAGHDAIYCRVL